MLPRTKKQGSCFQKMPVENKDYIYTIKCDFKIFITGFGTTLTYLGQNRPVRRMYHGCGGSTKKRNEGKDGDLANECGHGFED